MVWTPTPPVTVTAGARIAQLVPFHAAVPHSLDTKRGNAGFGSTGDPQVCLAISTQQQKPQCTITLTNKLGHVIQILALLDTGADITIISRQSWPNSWPCIPENTMIGGVGGTQSTLISTEFVTCELPDGAQCKVKPYVMTVPINLVGRDVLSQFGAKLITDTHF